MVLGGVDFIDSVTLAGNGFFNFSFQIMGSGATVAAESALREWEKELITLYVRTEFSL